MSSTPTRHTFLVEPFDIAMHADETAITSLHARFTAWLRTLNTPARFMYWLMPATLKDKISRLTRTQQQVAQQESTRAELLMEYRRHYESLQSHASYQHSLCGMALWSNESERALANGMMMAFETYVQAGEFPALFSGRYKISDEGIPHFAPAGVQGGRLLWAVLTSYEFLPVRWDFGQPADGLLMQNFPLAICVDIPQSYERGEGVEKIEGKMAAYRVHLSSLKGTEDSRAVQGVEDCRRALREINGGDTLHRVSMSFAIGAPDLASLRERVGMVQNHMRQWMKLRLERGSLLRDAILLFSGQPTKGTRLPDTTWTATSHELALLLSPMGYRKMMSTDGVMRGEAVKGGYPIFHNSWRDKRATHEIWVGSSGYGKTFMNNCYLLREYAENGIPFDLLEPMGHGRHLAAAIGITPYNLSARSTVLNPQDVMYPTLTEQISHTIRLYETVLGRVLSGGQQQNLERGLLAETLALLYSGFPDLTKITPALTPTCLDVVDVLRGLGDTDRKSHLARELADEIASLCCGNGPWAKFLNGTTNVDLSRGGKHQQVPPRVFMFHEMSDDPILLALSYTQVLSAIRRDSLIDELPRIIAVDEVYRLMRYEPLLDFLIEAAKTFRTRRKKLICIDQNMMYFLQNKARYIFENSPIRVIFSQRQGMNVFHDDAAFQHFNQAHLQTIAALQRFHYVLDIQEEGIWFVYNNPSEGEVRRFQSIYLSLSKEAIMTTPVATDVDLSVRNLEDSAYHAYREWHVYLILRQKTLTAQQVQLASARTPKAQAVASIEDLALASGQLSKSPKEAK